jgi:undecaprenyl-diphosphatase
MDWILLGKALVLGVVEGLTEFLPISSTGHLILVGDLLDFSDEKAKVFEIVIQCGAILAICWEYRAKFWSVIVNLPTQRNAQRFAFNLLVAFVPIAVLGLLLGKAIKAALFKPVPVAIAFIVGALVILWAERRKHTVRVESVDDMTWRDALKVGLAQCCALIPGTSRAGATIIGGLLFGLSRRARREFSFFLAVPVLFAASGYELYHQRALLQPMISACSSWASYSLSWRRFCACAGCCATSASTTSRRSPGIGSVRCGDLDHRYTHLVDWSAS